MIGSKEEFIRKKAQKNCEKEKASLLDHFQVQLKKYESHTGAGKDISNYKTGGSTAGALVKKLRDLNLKTISRDKKSPSPVRADSITDFVDSSKIRIDLTKSVSIK